MRFDGQRLVRVLRVPFEWIGIACGLLFLTLPPRRVTFAFCDLVSRLHYAFDRRGRRQALYNLRVVRGVAGLPPTFKDLAYEPTACERTVIRASYRNMARAVGLAFRLFLFPRRRIRSIGTMAPRTRDFLHAHRPVVAVSGHLGGWEALTQLASLEGHAMISVAKNIGTSGMTRLLAKSRSSLGQEIVPSEGAFRPLLAGLKAGRTIGLLVDQMVKPKHGGQWVRFFGRPTPVTVAPAFFAAKCKVPVLVAWARPLKDGTFRIEFVSSYTPDEARDVWRTTQAITNDLARVIRRHPSCWLLAYNAFRRRPTDSERAELEAREKGAGA